MHVWNLNKMTIHKKKKRTPETKEYHLTLRRDIHFCKGSMRAKTVHLSIMELNT
jgi:hypothetical protein